MPLLWGMVATAAITYALLTMVPSFFVVAMGYNATNAFVLSQVVLSTAVPRTA